MIFSRKIHLKMTFLVALKKMMFILKKCDIFYDRKTKSDKKVQIHIGKTSATNVYNTSNRFVVISVPSLISKNLRSNISIFTSFFKVTFICYRINFYQEHFFKCSTSLIIKNGATSRTVIYLRHVSKNSYQQKLPILTK